MKVKKIHPVTGETNELDLDVTVNQFNRWRRREAYIQEIMPELTADEREFLISGLLPGEYDEMFKNNEENHGNKEKI